MKPRTPAKSEPDNPLVRGYAILFGAFLGLTLLKFSNVTIFERLATWPTNGWEWALNPWPLSVGYGLVIFLTLAGIGVAKWQVRAPRWLVGLPLAWLMWQFVAGSQSVDAGLTAATLKHFVSCVACFYVGYLVLGRRENPVPFLSGLIVALGLVIALGFQQHFGGLKQTREYFFTYLYDQVASMPPEMQKKIMSDRIWSTLFYPNTLAGALLLLLPFSLVVILEQVQRLTVGARQFVAAVVGFGALACLFWSGSKGGWLLMLLLGLIALLRLPYPRRWKLILVGVVLIGGLVGFGVKYAAFFRKGATSVGARFDYWRAAVKTAAAHPAFGTGPGTFAIPYARIKRPESEMARLVHNDYLQQASDSGWVGFVIFGVFVVGSLVYTRPRLEEGNLRFAIWLGVLGWWLQGLMEFGLYSPACAWITFALTGWLLATRKPVDKACLSP